MNIFNPTYKQKITTSLQKFLSTQQKELSSVNTWGTDISQKLLEFTTQGKMIRGNLVLFIYDAYTDKITSDAIQIATALELFHSSLLIQDDIIDNDSLRRGQQTIFKKYEILGDSKQIEQPQHFGQSMGICVGDIGFFLAYKILTSLEYTSINQTIIKTLTEELINVGLAQMQDIYTGHTKESLTEKEIKNLYLYKTGRYTFSLPLLLGTILAHQNQETLNKLEELGENLGIIFQLKDDQLSIFGNQKTTGKPEGSDIRENKKTLYHLHLFQKSTSQEIQKLNTIFGKKQLNKTDLNYIKNQIKELKINALIDKKIQNLYNKANQSITDLKIPKPFKEQLHNLLKYSIERTN